MTHCDLAGAKTAGTGPMLACYNTLMFYRTLLQLSLLVPILLGSTPQDEQVSKDHGICKREVIAFMQSGGAHKFPDLSSVAHAFSLRLKDPLNKPVSRTVRLLPDNGWGEPLTVQGKTFSLYISVESTADAKNIVDQIIRSSPYFSKMRTSNGLQNGLEIPFYGGILRNHGSRSVCDYPMKVFENLL